MKSENAVTLIRALGKTFAKPLYRFLMQPYKNPIKCQQEILTKILRRNASTRFGKKHKFDEIRSIQAFKQRVSPHKYEFFRPYIEAMVNGDLDVLVPGKIPHWGITAGSTGDPKLIPITPHGVNRAIQGLLRLYFSYIQENPKEHSKFLDGTVCFFTANPAVRYINGTPVGFGTGVFSQSTQNQLWSPFIKRLFYSPRHIFQVKDLQQRWRALTEETMRIDIRAFAGVTSVVLGFLEIILKTSEQKNAKIKYLKDLFPNYHLSVLGGENPNFYERRFNSLVGHKIDIRELYGATEELMGVQLQETPGFTGLWDCCFLEFAPLEGEERLLVNEIKKHTPYKVILTNFNGLYGYEIGDIIEFISLEPPLFIFSHREGTINIGSGNMTAQQVANALCKTNDEQDTVVIEYGTIGKYNPKPHYIFIIEFYPSKRPSDMKAYLQALHQNLMIFNPSYRQLIEDLRNITEPHLWVVRTNTFFEIEQQNLAAGLPMGQQKVKHLSTDEKVLKQFEEYVTEIVKLE